MIILLNFPFHPFHRTLFLSCKTSPDRLLETKSTKRKKIFTEISKADILLCLKGFKARLREKAPEDKCSFS